MIARSRASSGSTTTGWTTPARTCTRAWSGCIRSTTRRTAMDMGDERQGLRLPGRPHRQPGRLVRRRLRHPAGAVRLPARRRRHDPQGHPRHTSSRPPATRARIPSGGARRSSALPQPRLRRRHLHRQRHRLPGDAREAAQVPAPVPRRVDRAHLRAEADELDGRARSRPCRSATAATSWTGSTGSRTASSA